MMHGQKNIKLYFFHIPNVQFDIIQVLFIYQLIYWWVALKRTLKFTLKFILKHLRRVSV